MITQTINLNLIPGSPLPRINVSQYDNGSRTLQFNLYNGVSPYEIPSGASVYIVGTKADKTGFEYACTFDGSLVSVDITDQMTVFAGEVQSELQIRQSDEILGTANFIINVERAALSDDTQISETDIPIIQRIPEILEEAEEYADTAHKWATFGADTETPSSTNNAKYWAEQSQVYAASVKTTLVTFSDLPKYGIATSGIEQINATLEEICKKVPAWCEVKIHWTGNDTNRFGTLANQIPADYGSLYIHKMSSMHPCVIEFIPYNSGNRYSRNYDYVNSADHLSEWINLNTVGYAIASNEPTATSSRAYSVGQYLTQGGRLKKVTSAIASGESITGNNTSNTTVGEELTDSVVPEDITVIFGSSTFTNKITFCRRIGKIIYYNFRFTTGSSTFPTSSAFALLSRPGSDLLVDPSQTSMRQNGFIMYDTLVNTTGTGITSDGKIGIYSGATLPANTNVIAFGFIMLK